MGQSKSILFLINVQCPLWTVRVFCNFDKNADKSVEKETNFLLDQGRPFTLCSYLIPRVSLIRRWMISVDKEL